MRFFPTPSGQALWYNFERMSDTAHKPRTEERPWGSFTEFARNEPVSVKVIFVKAGEAFSLQSHQKRDEFWHVISGRGFITLGDIRTELKVGADYRVPHGTKHRVEAGPESVVILEVSRREFDEKDVVRFEDRYGRAID